MTREFNFKVDWLLWFLVLLPTFYIAGSDLRSVQTMFFQISIMVLLGVMHINKYVGFLVIWSCIQFVLFKNAESLHLQNLVFGALLYQFIVIFGSLENFKRYVWALVGVLVISLVFSVLQYFQFDPVYSMRDLDVQRTFSEYPGIFGLPAFLGNYAAYLLPLGMAVSVFTVPFFIAALIIGKSTFSIVAAYLGAAFVLFFKNRKVFLIFLILGGLLAGGYSAMYDFPSGQFERRIGVWKVISHQAFKTQFFGHGLGNYQKHLFGEVNPSHDFVSTQNPEFLRRFLQDQAAEQDKWELVDYFKSLESLNLQQVSDQMKKHGMDFYVWAQAHNEFLQAFFEYGFVGMVIIFGYLIDLFRRFLKYGIRSEYSICLMGGLIALCVVSFGHFPFHLARLAGSAIFVLAFLDLSLIQAKRTSESRI